LDDRQQGVILGRRQVILRACLRRIGGAVPVADEKVAQLGRAGRGRAVGGILGVAPLGEGVAAIDRQGDQGQQADQRSA
jgi:hypothetical protein